ncbi:MAG: Phosphatase YidA [Thermoanaerobacterales bacterium 50_218]|nr:MAG: Phosphatase YidA [Thermoanaerobacterales bacterium 50_218]HAA90028.1 Cof-type HAD-IIB family hydrolase [Peptococcaceae bacterium]
MQEIKLVAIDLDDTLLRDDLTISPYSKETIRAVRERGVAVTLATGRMFRSALPYAQELGFDVPLITYQGALVKNAFSGEVIYHCPLTADVAEDVIDIAREKNLQVNFYLNDHLYVERLTPLGAHYPRFARVPCYQVGDLKALLHKGNPLKLLLIEDETMIDELAREVKAMLGSRAHVTKSKPRYLEVVHPRATKAHALQELAHWFGVSREEIMAFGDSFNDIEMLEFAGLGVAVANAPPEVRICASHVTSSNNEDGVARALEEFLLDKNL